MFIFADPIALLTDQTTIAFASGAFFTALLIAATSKRIDRKR